MNLNYVLSSVERLIIVDVNGVVLKRRDVDKAKEIIKQCQQRYKDTFC